MDDYHLQTANFDACYPYAHPLAVLRADTPSAQQPFLAPSFAPAEAAIWRVSVKSSK